MRSWLVLLGTLFLCMNANARPLVIGANDSVRIQSAAEAHAGDRLIAIEWRLEDPSDSEGNIVLSANAYRRDTSGQWNFEHQLKTETVHYTEVGQTDVAMSAEVAGVQFPSGLYIFERAATGWTESPVDVEPRILGTFDVDGRTILATEPRVGCSAVVLDRMTDGRWGISATLAVPSGSCVGALDLQGSNAILGTQSGADHSAARVHFFERIGSRWNLAATFASPVPAESFGRRVAIDGALALASGSEHGTHVYRRNSMGWRKDGILTNPDSHDGRQSAELLQISDDHVLAVSPSVSNSDDIGYLYRHRPDHTFEHLANLIAPSGLRITGLSGRTALAGGGFGAPYLFDLPETFAVPDLVQDDFESGSTSQWSPLPRSAFALARSGNSHVYRQSSVAGDAGAIHEADRGDQSVSLDVRPIAFNGVDRWVGMMARYQDESNYYYLTLRNSRRIVLKRMLNGQFVDLASGLMDVVPGRQYRLTLECIGSRLTVYIDGQRWTSVFDGNLTRGRAGLRTYKASADFDNVVVSPGPVATLAFSNVTPVGGTWTSAPTAHLQSSTDGNARVLTGVPREDAVVQAAIMVNEFAGTGSPWAGLVARYVDANNYYYVTARKTNELSLRKLTDGAITVLGTVPLPVAPGREFMLRLETIGDRVRVYVNGVLRIESAGAEIEAGQVGLMTYRAAAQFNRYNAFEP